MSGEVKDLEEMLDQCHTLLSEARALLPDVRMELRILRSSHAYSTLTKYLDSLEGQLETLAGMALSLSDIPPNSTHVEYVKQMSKPMARLLRSLQEVSHFDLSVQGEGQYTERCISARSMF